jgi:hypothetical protein
MPWLSEPEVADMEAYLANMLLILPIVGVHASGGSKNGRTEWLDGQGRTLRENQQDTANAPVDDTWFRATPIT